MKAKQSGFTLIEILVVIVILGVLGAIAVPRFFGQIDKAQITKAKQDIKTLQSALDIYRLDNNFYPSNSEGLEVLVGNYINKLPVDPWGKPYIYLNPGLHQDVDIYTLGKDGTQGGLGVDADVGNWSN